MILIFEEKATASLRINLQYIALWQMKYVNELNVYNKFTSLKTLKSQFVSKLSPRSAKLCLI